MQNEVKISGSTNFNLKVPSAGYSSTGEQVSRGNKILIISQERDTCELLKTFVELWGYKPLICDSPQQIMTIEGKSL